MLQANEEIDVHMAHLSMDPVSPHTVDLDPVFGITFK